MANVKSPTFMWELQTVNGKRGEILVMLSLLLFAAVLMNLSNVPKIQNSFLLIVNHTFLFFLNRFLHLLLWLPVLPPLAS